MKEYGGSVLNPSFDEYAPHFQLARDVFCKFPPPLAALPAGPDARRKNFRHRYYEFVRQVSYRGLWRRKLLRRLVAVHHVSVEQVCILSRNPFRQLAREKKLIFLYGWWYRDYTNFDKHADAIRQFFQPAAPIQKNVDALLAQCRTQGKVVVGIHIRRGDYKEHREGRYFYEPRQYADLMRATAALFPGQVHFLICSNETVNPETFKEFSFTLGNNHLVEDLYSFAQCDYILGPPSTYTMWASFMGQVPLYQVFDPHAAFSPADFRVNGGNCDVPEDRARWPEPLDS